MALMIVTSSPLPPWIMQVFTQLPLAACSKIRRAYKSVSFLWLLLSAVSLSLLSGCDGFWESIGFLFFSKRGRNSNAIFFFQMVQNSFDKTVTSLKLQQKHAQSRVTSVRWISNSFTLQFSELFANAVMHFKNLQTAEFADLLFTFFVRIF